MVLKELSLVYEGSDINLKEIVEILPLSDC